MTLTIIQPRGNGGLYRSSHEILFTEQLDVMESDENLVASIPSTRYRENKFSFNGKGPTRLSSEVLKMVGELLADCRCRILAPYNVRPEGLVGQTELI